MINNKHKESFKLCPYNPGVLVGEYEIMKDRRTLEGSCPKICVNDRIS